MKNQFSIFGIVLLAGMVILNNAQTDQGPNIAARNIEESVLQTQRLVNLTLDKTEKPLLSNNKPDPNPIPDTLVCRCNGSKVITHGDGHQTSCQCSTKPGGCICKPLSPPLPPRDQKAQL